VSCHGGPWQRPPDHRLRRRTAGAQGDQRPRHRRRRQRHHQQHREKLGADQPGVQADLHHDQFHQAAGIHQRPGGQAVAPAMAGDARAHRPAGDRQPQARAVTRMAMSCSSSKTVVDMS